MQESEVCLKISLQQLYSDINFLCSIFKKAEKIAQIAYLVHRPHVDDTVPLRRHP